MITDPHEASWAARSTQLLATARGLTITFPGAARPAVADVDLTLERGQCIALVGESGSGKSMTGRALLGLVPDTARVIGEIRVIGPEGNAMPAPAPASPKWAALRGIGIGMIPQDALGGLDPLRRVEAEVGDALRLHRIGDRSERRARVLTALADAGMPNPSAHVRRRADELSGGQRQRALVASALIAEPSLIIADEPTTALDAGHRARILAELRQRTEAGAGVLLISHDLASVRDVADLVLVMRHGRIVERGRPAEVFARPAHPFTRELLASSPAGKPRGTRLLTQPSAPRTPAAAPPQTPEADPAHAPHPAGAALAVTDVTVGFGQRTVIDGATFAVRHGETVGLVGESGSGKTTLLRVTLGLLAAERGEVRLSGVDLRRATRAQRRALRQQIAVVPQDPLDSFPPHATGAQILGDALRAVGLARRDRAGRIAELADAVHLAGVDLARPATMLSGGQRQRLAIARALAKEPRILLLDEPVSALDVTVQARILDLLDDLQLARGTAFLFVSHDADVIHHMSDRVLRLEHGRILPETTGR